MKKLNISLFLIALLFSFSVFGQNIYNPEGLSLIGSWDSWVRPPSILAFASATQITGGNVTFNNTGTPRYSTSFHVSTSGGDIIGGNYEFLFTSGPSTNYFANKWGGVTVQFNVLQDYNYGGENNNITVTNGKWYTMNWQDNNYTNTKAIFMETSSEPVNITSVTRTPNLITSTNQVTINVQTATTKSTEEQIYVRYSTDNWQTSSISAVNFTGIAGTATIPAFQDNTEVSYYVFSTTIVNPTDNYDMLTIKMNNNDGENYTYTVQGEISCSSDIDVVTFEPPFPLENSQVKITFNAALGNGGLMGYTGDVYVHTGVLTNLSTGITDWKYVKTTWGQNTPETKLTRIGTDLYELNIPNIRTYYGVPTSETIQKMAFVFRSGIPVSGTNYYEGKNADGSDIFAEVYQPGLNVKILSPGRRNPLVSPDQVIPVCVASLDADSIILYIDNNRVFGSNVADLSYQLFAGDYSNGLHWIKAIAKKNGSTTIVKDSVPVYVRGPVITAELPSGVVPGINYISPTEVTLVLKDPIGQKKFAFVIGEFNNWVVSDASYMKRTADKKYYWVTLTGLTPGKEYTYQYYIDGKLKIADPYCEKILDPWNDKYISSSIYPGLKAYPFDAASGIISIFQTSEPAYTWEIPSFTPVAVNATQSNLIIYELLIRDFVSSGDIKDVTDSIEYLKNLGITAVELMPIQEFEGNDSWGYNPSFYFAPDKAYGKKNDYKKFIDICHKNGIAVILDIVLNHSFSQSPLVRMYFNEDSMRVTPNNPWYNEFATHPYSPGYDFNHESQETRDFVKRVLHFWLTEYKIDGFRFDLSKGFTQNYTGQNVSAWSQYDQSRINIWEDYNNYIKSINANAYVILEHLGEKYEEKALADMGMMPWGKMSDEFGQCGMGYESNSNFSKAYYNDPLRELIYPNLIPYMESHDEERLMFKNITWGGISGNYNTKDTTVALKRMKALAASYFGVPGPKMIWQFGELGYDISIDSGGRTSKKPVKWDYFDQQRRQELYWVYAMMAKLKIQSPSFLQSNNFYHDLTGFGKRQWITPTSGTNICISANYGLTGFDMVPGFQHTGTWYNYFTGESVEVTNTATHSFYYNPGDFFVFTDEPTTKLFANITFDIKEDSTNQPINDAKIELNNYGSQKSNANGQATFMVKCNTTVPYTVSKQGYNKTSGVVSIGVTDITHEIKISVIGVENIKTIPIRIFPNPSRGLINISADNYYKFEIFDITGKKLLTGNLNSGTNSIDLTYFKHGVFIIRIADGKNIYNMQIILE